MRNMLLSKLVAIVVAFTLVVGIAGSALAAAPATPSPEPSNNLAFAIYPAGKHLGDYFDATIKAEDQATLQVVLGNTGGVSFKARTLSINAGTAPNGGFKIADPGAKPEGVTTWLDYPQEDFTLEPGKGVQVPLTIKVPKGTASGQYLTALVMETADASSVGNGTAFKQVIRQAVPVFITVPGPVEPKFTIGNITLDPFQDGLNLVVEIKNPGNVRVRPTGTVKLEDAKGAGIATAPVTMSSVYARDETTLTLGLPVLPSGDYKISLDLKDPDTGATASVSDVPVSIAASATPVAGTPIIFKEATATPQPTLEKIQFLNIAVTISNGGAAVTNARLTLSVSKNGKAVEDFPLSTSLALPAGDTAVQSRYIPANGWSSGSWTFTLKLETVDQSSGATTVIAVSDLGGPISIP